MTRLVEHPYLLGLGVTILLVGVAHLLPVDALEPTQTRGLGLAVYGGTLALLLRVGMDRDDVVWFFMGGACGLVLCLPLTIGFAR